MPRKRGLAIDRHVKVHRGFNLERKAATEYPDVREKLLAEAAQLREEIKTLDAEIKTELREAAKRVKTAALDYATARRDWLRLQVGVNGHDPGIGVPEGYRVDSTGVVREALLAVLNTERAGDPLIQLSDEQRVHEEKVRNERAGKGYRTDAQVAADYDPLKDFGAGGTVKNSVTRILKKLQLQPHRSGRLRGESRTRGISAIRQRGRRRRVVTAP